MSVVYLTRTDASRNMARFYRLDVQPDLFGQWSLVREWGRIGSGGQVRVAPYPSEDLARAAQEMAAAGKIRRGYTANGLPYAVCGKLPHPLPLPPRGRFTGRART